MKTLRLILGDQLNINHSWFQQNDPEVTYLLMEVRSEATYVRHHIQKIVAFFLAMRAFADQLRARGFQVRYLRLNDLENRQSIPENVREICEREGIERFEYQLPDEYRLDTLLRELSLPCEIRSVDTEHFLTSRFEVREMFKKGYLMETFYRAMRKRYSILVEDGAPIGGQWNFDAENRRKLRKGVVVPKALTFPRDVREYVQLIRDAGIETIGTIDAKDFPWAVTREEGLELLSSFCSELLPFFGEYQDALASEEKFLFHSRLSFVLNTKLLSPLEVIKRVVHEWEMRKGEISLAQVEGFVRQILGWREYMRGIYWAEMPGFREKNFFGFTGKLPEFYWTGVTKMRCLEKAIGQSLSSAYAHHIQRLMVTGNFALLAGVDPREVDEWYLGIYIDALEWVELPNTRGMSQFADGGIVATKPYVSSANYIDKMSDYCGGCSYNRAARSGTGSCPFNSLYWSFLVQNREKLSRNHRMGMIYKVWDGMKDKEEILQTAEYYKKNLDSL